MVGFIGRSCITQSLYCNYKRDGNHRALSVQDIFIIFLLSIYICCLSSIRWLMLRTIQSNAVCVSCLALFVWLVVLMSWEWQNRCSRYLISPVGLSLSLPLKSMYSFHPSLSLQLSHTVTLSAFCFCFFALYISLSLLLSHPLSVSHLLHSLFL